MHPCEGISCELYIKSYYQILEEETINGADSLPISELDNLKPYVPFSCILSPLMLRMRPGARYGILYSWPLNPGSWARSLCCLCSSPSCCKAILALDARISRLVVLRSGYASCVGPNVALSPPLMSILGSSITTIRWSLLFCQPSSAFVTFLITRIVVSRQKPNRASPMLVIPAYTWFRTGKGSQRQWLHKIGKAEDPSCPCGAAVQSGEHIAWQCRLHHDERRRNRVEETRGWEDLDAKIWVPGEGGDSDNEDQVDRVGGFFNYLAYQF